MKMNLNYAIVSLLIAVTGVNSSYGSRLGQVISSSDDVEDHILMSIQEAPIHKNIVTTVFWVGERAKPNSGWSDNIDSAWDMNWKENFGGLDSPVYRKGFFPAKFTPKQNPFYVALPFNDISNPEYIENCPLLKYFKATKAPRSHSICKNRWIEVMHGGKVCFAQWQDVGPIYTDDHAYVFGSQAPKAHSQDMAGLDVSPAVRDYLTFKGLCRSTWRFVEDSEVPEGPWKTVVTRS
jgi:hypothetical protein